MANYTIRFQSKPLPNGKERPIRKMGVPQYIRDPEGETPKGVSPVTRIVGLEEAKKFALDITARDELVLLEILGESGQVAAKLI
jgi:hypothetical protein